MPVDFPDAPPGACWRGLDQARRVSVALSLVNTFLTRRVAGVMPTRSELRGPAKLEFWQAIWALCRKLEAFPLDLVKGEPADKSCADHDQTVPPVTVHQCVAVIKAKGLINIGDLLSMAANLQSVQGVKKVGCFALLIVQVAFLISTLTLAVRTQYSTVSVLKPTIKRTKP